MNLLPFLLSLLLLFLSFIFFFGLWSLFALFVDFQSTRDKGIEMKLLPLQEYFDALPFVWKDDHDQYDVGSFTFCFHIKLYILFSPCLISMTMGSSPNCLLLIFPLRTLV
jgi:hypothetical protein